MNTELGVSWQFLQVYNTVLASLALLSLAGAAALVVYRIVRGEEAARNLLGDGALWLAWLVALVSTAGSLFYSEVIGFEPCRLCWFQRIFMYPMSVVLLVGAWRKEAATRLHALPLALIGVCISIYHYLVQIYPSIEGGSCDPNNPCSMRYVEGFGFVSIPFMAGAGFTLIAVLLWFYAKAKEE